MSCESCTGDFELALCKVSLTGWDTTTQGPEGIYDARFGVAYR